MTARKAALAAIACLLALPLAPIPAGAAAGAALEWWGPKAIDEGHHMRVPVTVSNPHPYPLTNAPVAVELDLGALLLAAGWTGTAGGDRQSLSGFRLDGASIRVVAMTNLLPADNVNGRLKVADPTFPAGDDRRYEVPSTHVEGSLQGGRPFDAAQNPVVTVLWRVAGTLRQGDERHFVVYFDSVATAQAKAPRADGLTLADGDLRSLYWSGPGLLAFGYVAPPTGQPGRIHVTAVHDATAFRVFTSAVGPPGSPSAPLQPLPGGNSFSIDKAGSMLQVPVTTTGPVAVQVVADRPVLVQGASAGFVPALDGGMTGREFLFYAADAGAGQDTLYVTAMDPRDDDGLPEPTRVEVTALDTGRVLVYETGTEGSPFHYTVGPRASMQPSSSTPCRDDGASPFLAPGTNVQTPPPALYRARVISGEAVQLQLLTATGVSQVPSAIGAPAGDRFWAAVPFSEDNPGRFSPCASVSTTVGVWWPSSLQGATGNVTSPELTYQVSPPGTPSPPGPPQGRYPPPLAIPQAPAFAPPATVAGRPAADRPLQVSTSAESVVLAGINTLGAGLPPKHGPWGGDDAGRLFVGAGRSLVFAPYEGTAVGSQLLYAQGGKSASLPIATGSYAILDDASAQNPLRSFRMQANRPVLVTPADLSTSFFPSVPAMLLATPEPASYRGYLVDLSAANGLDPLTGSTPPGIPLTQTLRLTNRGRALDGSLLPDLVRVTATVPAGWTATLDGVALSPSQGPTVSLAGGESRPLQLRVQPPDGLASGASGTVSLLAVSQNNELVRDPLDVVTFVKTVHDVGLWFDAIDGAKEQENRSMSAAGVANFRLVVQNQGSKTETIRLVAQFKAGETTWAARLGGPDGSLQLDLPLSAREAAVVPLALQAPPGLVDGEATVVVTAQVVGVPASKDAVQATAARRAPADLSVEADGLTRVVQPGRDAVFNLTLRNRGAGAANVQLALRAGPAPAWDAPRILVAGVQTPDVAVDPGGSVRVQVVIPAKAAALAGQSATLRFGARQEGAAAGALETVLTAVVGAVHRIDVGLPPLPLALGPGSNTSVELRLRNDGNLDEDLLVRAGSLPAGWRLDGTLEALVPRGASTPVRLELHVPAGAPPQRANVTLDLVARDGNVTRVRLPAEVGLGSGLATGDGVAVPVQPGEVARLRLPAANEGNTPLVVRVRAAQGEAWELVAPSPVRLLPGERTTLSLGWRVPPAAPDGASIHRAILALEPDGLEASARPVEAAFDVGRPDLQAGDIATAEGPAGRLVHAVVRNAGTRPAIGFEVTLRAGDVTLDRQVVGELRPGAQVAVTLLQARAGAASLALDANGTVVEANEADNVVDLLDARPRDAAPPALALAVAALAVAALATRRRRA